MTTPWPLRRRPREGWASTYDGGPAGGDAGIADAYGLLAAGRAEGGWGGRGNNQPFCWWRVRCVLRQGGADVSGSSPLLPFRHTSGCSMRLHVCLHAHIYRYMSVQVPVSRLVLDHCIRHYGLV